VETECHQSIGAIAGEWDALAERTRAAPWNRPGWFEAWWHAFGHGALEIHAVRRNGALAGVLPLVVRRGSVTTPTNAHTPAFSPVAEDQAAREDLARALFSLARGKLELLCLPANDPMLSTCEAAARRRSFRIRRRPLLRSPFVPIAGDWATFEAGLRSHFRSEVRRRGRRLAEHGSVELSLVPGGDALDALLAEGFGLEARAWKGANGSAITSRPETERFYHDVAHWGAERGILRLAFLRLDGRPLAFELCLRQHGVHYNIKGGYDPEFQRFGPSRLLHHRLLERSFADGCSSYEFLGNDEPWKLDWAPQVRETTALQAFSHTPAGVATWATLAGVDQARRARHALRRQRSRVAAK